MKFSELIQKLKERGYVYAYSTFFGGEQTLFYCKGKRWFEIACYGEDFTVLYFNEWTLNKHFLFNYFDTL